MGVAVLRHRPGGRLGGLFIGGLLVVGGLIAGYVAFDTWLRANNPGPGVSFPSESVSFGLNDVAVAVPLLIAGAYLIWALGGRWFTGRPDVAGSPG